ncbi:hypothetical protein GCM10009765_03310 [Fodinicola feengrottensis]|uniref:Uncharacterized protein n=1 Tax=Fodinicola feengrottensis TaxID=435914 RepID=A0ABN2FR63_9ACTN
MSTKLTWPQLGAECLHLDSHRSIQSLMSALDTNPQNTEALRDVLGYIPDTNLFFSGLADPDLVQFDIANPNDCEPYSTSQDSGTDWEYNLTRLGVVTNARTEWYDAPEDAYVSGWRCLTSVLVPISVRPTEIAVYQMEDSGWWQGQVGRRFDPIPAGWYLVGSSGNDRNDGDVQYTCCYLGDGGRRDLVDSIRQRINDITAFHASRCDIECSSCGSHWYADSGSRDFQPTTIADPLHFGEIEFERPYSLYGDGRARCPRCDQWTLTFAVSATPPVTPPQTGIPCDATPTESASS